MSASSGPDSSNQGKSRPEGGRNRMYTACSRSLCGSGNGRKRTALTMVKMAAFDPMPSASVRIAAKAKVGRFLSVRAA